MGQRILPDVIQREIKITRPKMLAIVQGDTSTTMLQPLKEIGEICREEGVLFYCDATASIGGNELKTDAWYLRCCHGGITKMFMRAIRECTHHPQ